MQLTYINENCITMLASSSTIFLTLVLLLNQASGKHHINDNMNNIIVVTVQWLKSKDFLYNIHIRYSYVHFLPRVLAGYIMFLMDATS